MDLELANGSTRTAAILVNAAGAWADGVAAIAGAAPLGIAPKRRTMVQLRVGRPGLKDLPLVDSADGTSISRVRATAPCGSALTTRSTATPATRRPKKIDVALAIERFQEVVDWPIEAVERRWAGLRSFAPDRLPVYGFDSVLPAFFWCAGQGGFGIQTSPAAAMLAPRFCSRRSSAGFRARRSGGVFAGALRSLKVKWEARASEGRRLPTNFFRGMRESVRRLSRTAVARPNELSLIKGGGDAAARQRRCRRARRPDRSRDGHCGL